MEMEYIFLLVTAALIAGVVLIILWPMEGLFVLIGLRLLFENPPFMSEMKTSMITNAFGGVFLLLTMVLLILKKGSYSLVVKPVTFYYIFLLATSFSFFSTSQIYFLNACIVFLKLLSMPCMFLLTYNFVKDKKSGEKALLYLLFFRYHLLL